MCAIPVVLMSTDHVKRCPHCPYTCVLQLHSFVFSRVNMQYGKAVAAYMSYYVLHVPRSMRHVVLFPQFGEAAAAYTEGLKVARSRSDKARLAYNRSAAFARWVGHTPVNLALAPVWLLV